MSRLKASAGLFGFVVAGVVLFKLLFLAIDLRQRGAGERITVGSKADTEGLVLGEIMAQLLEQQGQVEVVRRMQLGGTQLCFQALLAGEIDVYPEYTGTALVALLDRPVETDPRRTFGVVRDELGLRFGLQMLEPLAFNNTYALTMTRKKATELGLRTISDLKRHPELRAGFTAEFLARQDGYPGLERVYGLEFTEAPVSMEAGLMYDAVARGQVDVVDAYATDGRITKLDLQTLRDDRGFFPPYQAAPLLGRPKNAETQARVRRALQVLGGRLPDAEMRKLNAAVDIERRSPRDVARAYVQSLLRAKRSSQSSE
jgi:glycine betaine/choline ABC-type transport system substrate-binding protein